MASPYNINRLVKVLMTNKTAARLIVEIDICNTKLIPGNLKVPSLAYIRAHANEFGPNLRIEPVSSGTSFC
jgi:hypothetical protein